jgi:methylase of polypeptide subunit release factors
MEIAEKHINSYLEKRGVLPESILDIGSGSDLSLPLLMKLKIRKVVASDINRLANNYLIENINLSLSSIPMIASIFVH